MSTLAKEVSVAEKALRIKVWAGLFDSKVVNLTKFGGFYSVEEETFSCDKLVHV